MLKKVLPSPISSPVPTDMQLSCYFFSTGQQLIFKMTVILSIFLN